jgi:hypothetical protein
MINLNKTVINIQHNARKILKKLEDLGYVWVDGALPTHFIPEEDAKWLVINRKFITYTCRSDHGHYDYKDATEDLLINKKDLYND